MATTTRAAVDERIFPAYGLGDSAEPAYPMEQPVHRMHVTSEITGGKDIGVGIVDARRHDADGKPIGETIFIAMGYAAMLEPHAIARFEQMAAERRARIVVPEYPGVGMNASRVRFSFGLALGSFKKTGTQMAKVAGRVAGLAKGEKVTVMGYSQGAAACVEMARVFDQRGINVNKLTLIEPVSNQRHFLAWVVVAVTKSPTRGVTTIQIRRMAYKTQ